MFVSFCCLRERLKKKKCLTLAAFFLHLENPSLPACYPLTRKAECPSDLDGKEPACNAGDPGLDPWVRKIPWRREWQPSPVFLPGKSNEWKSLAGPNLWDCKESDMTEQLTHSLKAECIYLPQRYAATKGRARVHPCSIDSQTQALCTLSGLFLQPSSPEAIDRV